MLQIAEAVQLTDTGRQREANDDSYFSRAPLFAVADGMGGAQAGEVASRMAVEAAGESLIDAGLIGEDGTPVADLSDAGTVIGTCVGGAHDDLLPAWTTYENRGPGRVPPHLHVMFPLNLLEELKAVFDHFPGDTDVMLEMETREGPRRLRFGSEYRVRDSTALRAELDGVLGPGVIDSGAIAA